MPLICRDGRAYCWVKKINEEGLWVGTSRQLSENMFINLQYHHHHYHLLLVIIAWVLQIWGSLQLMLLCRVYFGFRINFRPSINYICSMLVDSQKVWRDLLNHWLYSRNYVLKLQLLWESHWHTKMIILVFLIS